MNPRADLGDPHWAELLPDALAVLDSDLIVASLRSNVSSLSEVFHPDDTDLLRQTVNECFRTGEPGAVGIKAYVDHCWVEGWATVRNYLSNPIVGGLVLGWHRERNGEAERREIEAQIVMARDAAIEASRLKSEFLANMSHEIRTPLNGVIGMATLLLDTPLNREQRDRVVTLRAAGEHLLSLVNDILDFSKIETGRLELEQMEFELLSAVHEVVSLYASAAFDKGVRLRIDTDASLPRTVMGDPARLRQILANLVGNAVKFTEHGSITLRITSEGRHSPTVRFEVVDTGIGISSEAQARIFDPFVQAESSTTRRFGGTGLGLPICRQLVELMGGVLTVESRESKGSTFWFTIPFGDPTLDVRPIVEAATRDSRPTSNGDRAGKILLVEDNVINQQVAMGFLAHLGWDADVAADGLEALELASANSYRAILMDCQMPRMDGYESTARIRSMELGSGLRTPIIALTAGAMPGDRERCLEAGMDDYLSKPIDVGRLGNLLEQWTALTSAPAPVPAPVVPQPQAPLVDLDSVEQLRSLPGAKGSLFDDALAVFVEQAPRTAAVIAEYAEHERWDSVAEHAHALKGMSATIGASRVSQVAAAIEAIAKATAPDPSQMSALLPDLDDTLARTAQAFDNA